MPIVVNVVSQADYDAWVQKQKSAASASASEDTMTFSKDELLVRGKAVYEKSCAACHGVDGKAAAPIFPSMAGSAIANGPVAAHIDIVTHGSKKNTMMAAYISQLSKADIAAVVTYERNAFGNTAGDVVQPADIK